MERILPREIIIDIILFLPTIRDLLTLKSSSRYFYNLIDNSVSKRFKYIGSKYFTKNKWTWIYPLLRELSNYVVAGGQALQVYHNLNWLDSDLDIFFYNQNAETFITQAFHLFRRICQNDKTWIWSFEMKCSQIAGFEYFETLKLDKIISVKDVFLIRLSGIPSNGKIQLCEATYDWDKSKIRKIDLVYTKYQNPVELTQDFDLPFCGIGFEIDPKQNLVNFLKTSEENYEAARNKKGNIYTNGDNRFKHFHDRYIDRICRDPNGFHSDHNLKIDHRNILTKRIEKYLTRGFTTYIIPRSDNFKDRTLEDKERRRLKFFMNYTF